MSKKFILPALFLVSFVIAGTALAQSWIYFKSQTGLFSVRLYNNVKEDINEFRISDKTIAQFGQTVSTFDQRMFKDNVVKNYIIKYEQTIGIPFSQQDAAQLIKNELDLYTSYYSSLNGTLREKKDLFTKSNFPAGEVYVNYDDPKLGNQSIRITVLFTETSKIQHIISGPDDWITSYKTEEHYKSLDINNGYTRDAGSIQEEWRSITSPLRLFTIYLPPAGTPYFPQEYVSSYNEHIEQISAVFRDPIWNMEVYYNVYGYVPNGEVNYARAQSIVTQRHIKRHRLSADGLTFQQLPVADRNISEIEYDIVAPKGKPTVKWVKIRVEHADDKMVVHELLGPKHLIEGPFFEYLLGNAKFHPQLYLSSEEIQKMKAAEAKAKAEEGEKLKKLLEQGQEEEEQPAPEPEEPSTAEPEASSETETEEQTD